MIKEEEEGRKGGGRPSSGPSGGGRRPAPQRAPPPPSQDEEPRSSRFHQLVNENNDQLDEYLKMPHHSTAYVGAGGAYGGGGPGARGRVWRHGHFGFLEEGGLGKDGCRISDVIVSSVTSL